jgi:hypothetical protein
VGAKTHYLVDFENVGESALVKAGKLSATDYVHLFSTQNSAKISTRTLATLNLANLTIHEVVSGDQSVDMHLVSYLGYLIGTEDKATRFIIVSKDKDYDKVIDTWKLTHKVNVCRVESFQKQAAPAVGKLVKPKPTQKAKTANAATVSKQVPATTPTKATSPTQRTALNTSVIKTLSHAKYDNQLVGKVASAVVKYSQGNDRKQTIYRFLTAEYGSTKGLEIYRLIRGVL